MGELFLKVSCMMVWVDRLASLPEIREGCKARQPPSTLSSHVGGSGLGVGCKAGTWRWRVYIARRVT